jgi:hypothetical protein
MMMMMKKCTRSQEEKVKMTLMKMCRKLQEKVSYHCNTIFWYQDTVLILSKIPFLIPLFTCLSFSV